jgi:kinesin family protein 6/9
VLHNTSQQALFDEVVAPVIDSVLGGYNGTVLCYGQTGAGKTYTHIGSTSSYAQRGLAPRAISRIFQQLKARPQHEAVLTASYLEIHNDSLVDLLAHLPCPVPRHNEPLVIAEDKNGNVSVKGLRSIHVADEEAALAALFEGESARSVAKHELNDRSSRGHAVFTLTLAVKSRVESNDRMTRARLVMVDLAGAARGK